MERRGRVLMYPPIYDDIDDWGYLVHRVVLRDGRTESIGFLNPHPLPREEAHERVRQMLRQGLRSGRFLESDFYPQDPRDMYMQQLPNYVAAVDGRGLEEGHGCIRGIPASGEAILGLLETSVKEGECSVCLMDFETGTKLRVMPCSHYFHEHCIFTWLQLNHVCPLCRFPLPTEHKLKLVPKSEGS